MAHAQKYKLSTAPLKETKDTLCNSSGLQTGFVTGSTRGTTVGDDTYAQLRFQKVTDLLLTSQPKTLECLELHVTNDKMFPFLLSSLPQPILD